MLSNFKLSRFKLAAAAVVLGFTVIFLQGHRIFPHLGTPQKILTADRSVSLSQIRRLPEDKWTQVPFSHRIMNDKSKYVWIHTRVQTGLRVQSWSFANVFGWYDTMDFYAVADGEVSKTTLQFDDSYILPHMNIMLDANKSVDVYIMAKVGPLFIAEVHALPTSDFRVWQQLLTSYLGLFAGVLALLILVGFGCG